MSRCFWSDKEIFLLLNIIKEKHIKKLSDKKRTGPMFESVSEELADHGFSKSSEQIQFKFKNLKRLYFKLKRDQSEGGSRYEDFDYYKVLSEVMQRSPGQSTATQSIWSEKETMLMLNLLNEQLACSSPENNVHPPSYIFDKVVKELSDRGFFKTRDHVKFKFDCLKSLYFKIGSSDTASCKDFRYYDVLDKILGKHKSRCAWSEKEILQMLRVIKEKSLALACIDKRVANQVAQELAACGVYKTSDQIQIKFKNLKAQYNEMKRSLKQNSLARNDFQYYDLMCVILGNECNNADWFDTADDRDESMVWADEELSEDAFNEIIKIEADGSPNAKEKLDDSPSCSPYACSPKQLEPKPQKSAQKRKYSSTLSSFLSEWKTAQDAMIDQMCQKQHELMERMNTEYLEGLQRVLEADRERSFQMMENLMNIGKSKAAKKD